MKLPTKVNICGQEWRVRASAGYVGGSFDSMKPEICIGTQAGHWTPDIFLHEVIEACLTQRGHRYLRNHNDVSNKVMFAFDHNEFDAVVADIACALKGVRF